MASWYTDKLEADRRRICSLIAEWLMKHDPERFYDRGDTIQFVYRYYRKICMDWEGTEIEYRAREILRLDAEGK